MILEPTLVTLGQLFIVIGAFLAQMLKVKCISNVVGDTLLMLSRNIFYEHDASVQGVAIINFTRSSVIFLFLFGILLTDD